MTNTLAFIEAALRLAPMLIQTGQDVAEFAKWLYAAINNKGEPTAEDWAALEAKQEEMRKVLHAPLDVPNNQVDPLGR